MCHDEIIQTDIKIHLVEKCTLYGTPCILHVQLELFRAMIYKYYVLKYDTYKLKYNTK